MAAAEAAGRNLASHGPDITSLPADMLFAHLAPDILGDVAALRTSCRSLRTSASVVLDAAASCASLDLSQWVEPAPDEAHALGAALGSALKECHEPKNLSASLIGGSSWQHPCSVLDGMRESGAHQHVAALHLEQKALAPPVPTAPVLAGLAAWPHLQSLKVDRKLHAGVGMGACLAQLTGLQSLSLKVAAKGEEGGFNERTLHTSHLQQLSLLTSLSLGTEVSTWWALQTRSAASQPCRCSAAWSCSV